MVTKKWLGVGLIILGALGIFGAFVNDLFSLTDYQGIGPAQRVAIIVSLIPIIVGATLIPFGNNPA